jgi:hypothetical protein
VEKSTLRVSVCYWQKNVYHIILLTDINIIYIYYITNLKCNEHEITIKESRNIQECYRDFLKILSFKQLLEYRFESYLFSTSLYNRWE